MMREKSDNEKHSLGDSPNPNTGNLNSGGFVADIQRTAKDRQEKGLVLNPSAVDPRVTEDTMFDLIRIMVNKQRDGDSAGLVKMVTELVHEVRLEAYNQGYKDALNQKQ